MGPDGSAVNCWSDASEAGNHAVQSVRERAPVVRENQLNGNPAVMFEKDGQRLNLPLLNIPHETTIFIVSFDQPQVKGHQGLLVADNSPYRKDGDGYGIGYYTKGYEGALVVLGDGKVRMNLADAWVKPSRFAWEVLTFHKQGMEGTFLRDGTKRDSGKFSRTVGYHTGYLLGGDVKGSDYRGGLAEVMVYGRALSAKEVETVHSYLSVKYNIPVAAEPKATSKDLRFFGNGTLMLDSSYADQPYMIKMADHEWIAGVTTSTGQENSPDRNIQILRTTDAGKTWLKAGALEPPQEQRQPSWGTLLKTPSGRLYCFYNLNRLPGEGAGIQYIYRYSDNRGTSWSERYTMPVRETWHNKQFNSFSSWGIDQPLVVDDTVYISFSKFGPDSSGRQGEGFVFKSTNILYVSTAKEIQWEMLPEGEHGLMSARVGTLQEEHNIESLGNKNLYCAFRTLGGYVGESYSPDGGKTWTEPDFARYANGRKIKNPRACPMVWRCENGNYLLWFHNNDGRQVPARNQDRNPVWLSGGILKNGRILWSQPEPILFTFFPEAFSGMSYPSMVEKAGDYYIATTDKEKARLCPIDKGLVENLWRQDALKEIPPHKLLYDSAGATHPVLFTPDLGDQGFTITCAGGLAAAPNGLLWSALDEQGNGIVLKRTAGGLIRAEFKDRTMREPIKVEADAPVQNDSAVTFIFDGAANWVYVVVDGVLCDGGEARQFGGSPIPFQMGKLTDAPVVPVGRAARVLLHDRILSVSDTIGMHRALAE